MGFKVPKGVDKIPKTVRLDESDCEIIQKLADENKKSFNEVVNIIFCISGYFLFLML